MLLMTTVDDIPAEGLPYIIDKTIERGANNIHVLNALTKKGRMEYIIFVDLEKEKMDEICSLLALEFGTLGMKIFSAEHLMLPYEIGTKKVKVQSDSVKVNWNVRIKYLKNEEGQVISLKAEYEDLKDILKSLNSEGIKIGFSKLKTIIEAEAYQKILQKGDIKLEVSE
ncbi:MAG: nickel insertion protein [Methanomicrobiales archaeon]